MSEKTIAVKAKMFPEIGDAFTVLIEVDGNRDINEQVDAWVETFLSDVACQAYSLVEIDGKAAEERFQPKTAVAASRLEKIGAYKDNERMLLDAAQRERMEKTEGLVRQIKALKPRIDELLEVGNACLENGIELDTYHNQGSFYRSNDSYERGTFITNSISHRVGFAKDCGRNSVGPHKFAMLGINAGGACGSYNFRTNGDIVCFSHESKDGDFKDASHDLGDLKRFLQDFDKFESAFYAYVDKVIEEQQQAMAKKLGQVDEILSDAQARVQDAPAGVSEKEMDI